MTFARAWAGAPAGTDSQTLADDMRAFGVQLSPEQRANVFLEANAPFEVADRNWDAVTVFCGCATQWRTGMGGATGLDYPAVESVMRMGGITDTTDTLLRVQVLEYEVLDVWRKQQQQARGRNH